MSIPVIDKSKEVRPSVIDIADSVNALLETTRLKNIYRIAFGTTGRVQVPANGYADFTVTFSNDFSSSESGMPLVYLTCMAGSAVSSITAIVRSVTRTDFNGRIFNTDSAARSPTVFWIAISAYAS